MKSTSRIWMVAMAGTFFAAACFAQTGRAKVGERTTTASVTVTVTVPGIVAVDVGSEVEFDLASYLSSNRASGQNGNCPDNVFPPPAGCRGPVRYSPTASRMSDDKLGAAPAEGSVGLAVFCTKASGTLDIKAAVSDAWNGGGNPGFSTSALRVKRSPANNRAEVGFAQPEHLSTQPMSIGAGSLPTTFPWTRMDLEFDLELPQASSVVFSEGSFSTVVTLTVTKA